MLQHRIPKEQNPQSCSSVFQKAVLLIEQALLQSSMQECHVIQAFEMFLYITYRDFLFTGLKYRGLRIILMHTGLHFFAGPIGTQQISRSFFYWFSDRLC